LTEFSFLEVTPKIPSILLDIFLKYIKNVNIMTIINAPNETWIDFNFKGHTFQAHRDYEEWRFFENAGCPSDVKHELSKIMKYAENHKKFWPALLKGVLYNLCSFRYFSQATVTQIQK